MIVRKTHQGLHVIFQASHGLLAGKIAEQLMVKYRPPLWLETLVAVVEHDDQQLDYKEKNYLSELGIPLDFSEDSTGAIKSIKRAKRVFVQAKSKSIWTALLVSFHLDFLYGSLKEKNVKAKLFLNAQKAFRKKAIAYFGIEEKKALAHYALLSFCDRCSLILCKDEVPDTERKLEINTSIDGKTYYIHRQKNGTLCIEPWCFETDSFELSIEETILEQTKYKNQEELKDVLDTLPRRNMTWKFEK
ncbi:DUF3891 family protein [Mongoliibacter ruber]|uniref:Uncharacterized protein DUF3891 n=1 Tax=Mongoliibacter ruber TaxID=1750599 RepID=A0A2T0WDG3_9BACT|nr:DUF3891 family protein [Mongoliibacter ruber]PRY84748.1 uncharacterized protein DUF3891 [Mongoliibacter ruber]